MLSVSKISCGLFKSNNINLLPFGDVEAAATILLLGIISIECALEHQLKMLLFDLLCITAIAPDEDEIIKLLPSAVGLQSSIVLNFLILYSNGKL